MDFGRRGTSALTIKPHLLEFHFKPASREPIGLQCRSIFLTPNVIYLSKACGPMSIRQRNPQHLIQTAAANTFIRQGSGAHVPFTGTTLRQYKNLLYESLLFGRSACRSCCANSYSLGVQRLLCKLCALTPGLCIWPVLLWTCCWVEIRRP